MKITNPTVFLKDGELFCLTVEVPTRPNQDLPYYKTTGYHPFACGEIEMVDKTLFDKDVREYEQALASAKSSAVKVKNENEIYEYAEWQKLSYAFFKEGNIYTLTGYEAEVKYENVPCPDGDLDCGVWHIRPFATITPISTDNTVDKPILNEVYADNGELSHYNLIDPKTGENLWSQYPEEDNAMGFPVKAYEALQKENLSLKLENEEANDIIISLRKELEKLKNGNT